MFGIVDWKKIHASVHIYDLYNLRRDQRTYLTIPSMKRIYGLLFNILASDKGSAGPPDRLDSISKFKVKRNNI